MVRFRNGRCDVEFDVNTDGKIDEPHGGEMIVLVRNIVDKVDGRLDFKRRKGGAPARIYVSPRTCGQTWEVLPSKGKCGGVGSP